MHLEHYVLRLIFACVTMIMVIAFWFMNNTGQHSNDDDATQRENRLNEYLPWLEPEKESNRQLISKTSERFNFSQNNSFQDSVRPSTSDYETLHHYNMTSHVKLHNASMDIIVYNRVPKCGSTSTNKLLQMFLSKRNNFTFIRSTQYMTFWLSIHEQVNINAIFKCEPISILFIDY